MIQRVEHSQTFRQLQQQEYEKVKATLQPAETSVNPDDFFDSLDDAPATPSIPDVIDFNKVMEQAQAYQQSLPDRFEDYTLEQMQDHLQGVDCAIDSSRKRSQDEHESWIAEWNRCLPIYEAKYITSVRVGKLNNLGL